MLQQSFNIIHIPHAYPLQNKVCFLRTCFETILAFKCWPKPSFYYLLRAEGWEGLAQASWQIPPWLCYSVKCQVRAAPALPQHPWAGLAGLSSASLFPMSILIYPQQFLASLPIHKGIWPLYLPFPDLRTWSSTTMFPSLCIL